MYRVLIIENELDIQIVFNVVSKRETRTEMYIKVGLKNVYAF